jgi:peroxiredoxin (alkyl hydroperoxide reductase subunit C)
MLRPLDQAPAFAAPAVQGDGQEVVARLSDHRGRWLLLLFYPRDFTTVCPTEVRELSKRMPELRALGAEALAISVDEVATHRRWIAEVLGPVAVTLVSDVGGAVARAWGALLEPEGVAGRATYLVDPQGVIRYAAFHDQRVGRSISEILRVLEALRTGQGAPAEWRRGEPTLAE